MLRCSLCGQARQLQLVGMGFRISAVMLALARAGWDVEAAVEVLTA